MKPVINVAHLNKTTTEVTYRYHLKAGRYVVVPLHTYGCVFNSRGYTIRVLKATKPRKTALRKLVAEQKYHFNRRSTQSVGRY